MVSESAFYGWKAVTKPTEINRFFNSIHSNLGTITFPSP